MMSGNDTRKSRIEGGGALNGTNDGTSAGTYDFKSTTKRAG